MMASGSDIQPAAILRQEPDCAKADKHFRDPLCQTSQPVFRDQIRLGERTRGFVEVGLARLRGAAVIRRSPLPPVRMGVAEAERSMLHAALSQREIPS